jgi:protein ImuB
MSLAAARARHTTLVDLPATPAADLRSLEAMGHWLMRFSPGVCVYPPSSLFLDATGLERLYGGLESFRRRVAQTLATLRVTAAVTIAPTPGTAWALAAFGRNGSHIVTNEQVLPALSPLPPEALRLDSKTVGVLSALGVRTIGSLLQLPRNDLAVRFGPAILMRIDQATGAAPEPLTYLVHRSPIRATLEFEGAIESLDAIHFAVQELTRQIAAQLSARGQGARELRLTFRQPYASPVEKVIRLVRPCRNESALVKLICCAIENLEASEGFVAATLAVVAAERLGDEQAALIGGEEERDAAELDHLVERLRARLDRAVEWGELLESNLPENASRCRDTVGKVDAPSARSAVDLLRPLRLLPEPRSIKTIVRPSESRDGEPVSFTDYGEVHRLDHIRGPERITGQWWNGRWKTRDYFDVLDAAGDRYWIFRVAQSGRWFLHGIFE